MSKHLQRDLDVLTQEVLVIGGLVEEATNKAITALTERRLDLAKQVMASDDAIDEKEVEVEEDCLKILALHRPVGKSHVCGWKRPARRQTPATKGRWPRRYSTWCLR